MKRFFAIAALLVCLLGVGVTPALAQSGNIWQAEYFNNPNWSGAPVATASATWLSFDWGLGSPSPAVPVDNFTANFRSDAFFLAGNYMFTAIADDEFALLIDGRTVLDTRGQGRSGKQISLTIPMAQGTHRINVLYREWTVTAYIWLNWAITGGGAVQRPPGATSPVQPFPPLPASASSVQTQFGNFTPCLQQGIHQSNCFVSDGAWNSPNLGSVQMEPQIQSWVNCQPPDQITTFFLSPEIPMRDFVCSRTMAGWFSR